MLRDICVVGGDTRLDTVSALFEYDGYNVSRIGLNGRLGDFDSLKKAEMLILPIPVSYDDVYINAPLCDTKVRFEAVIDAIPDNCFVFGGCFSENIRSFLQSKSIDYCDYYNREELIIKNAIPTVEGAIEIALSELPITIFSSRVLIVGYGRIGKILADRFKSMGAFVTVSARKLSDFAWIEEKGLCRVHTNEIIDSVGLYDLIINTVPYEVLGRDVLMEANKDVLIIDLASKPGGVDFTAAKELGINVIWALSLPGKTAPISSGKIIKDTIVNILAEKGV